MLNHFHGYHSQALKVRETLDPNCPLQKKRNDNYMTWRVKGISWATAVIRLEYTNVSNRRIVQSDLHEVTCWLDLSYKKLREESLLPMINRMWIVYILEMPKTAVGCTVYGYLQKKFKEQKYGNTCYPGNSGPFWRREGERPEINTFSLYLKWYIQLPAK